MSVRVVDISTGGVLLQAARPIDLGLRGFLRFIVSGSPVVLHIQVERVAAAPDAPDDYRIGATFVGMSHEHRHLIERLIEP